MTLKELSQLYYLNREIERDKERLAKLYAKAVGGVQTITGVPYVSGASDKTGGYAAEIADLDRIIRSKLERCKQERTRIECYISNIPDSLTRQIFTYRFIDRLSWKRIAINVGGSNTEASVKMICYRYINNDN